VRRSIPRAACSRGSARTPSAARSLRPEPALSKVEGSLLTVAHSPANKPHLREITGLLAKLAPADLAAVQKFLASLPHAQARQLPATAKR
jgi:hypothetical protein